VEALTDADGDVRRKAAEALESLGLLPVDNSLQRC